MSTLLVLVSFVLVFAFNASICYWIGAKVVKAPYSGYWRALGTAVVVGIGNVGLLLGGIAAENAIKPADLESRLILAAAEIAVGFSFVVLVVRLVHRAAYRRSVVLALFGLLSAVPNLALTFFVMKPYVFEPYFIPTHAMSPTLLGPHATATCPHCGGTVILPVIRFEPDQRRPDEIEPAGNCSTCFKKSDHPGASGPIRPEDRILVNRLLTPRRWDMVVYTTADNPGTKYVKRLVALPGETAFIKNGRIWIDGEEAELPPGLEKLEYEANPEFLRGAAVGTEENPWKTGKDGCCVLGDNTLGSDDSRRFGPFPISRVEGVVGLRYAPLSRLQIFR